MKKEYTTPEFELVELFSRESLMTISGVKAQQVEDLEEDEFEW